MISLKLNSPVPQLIPVCLASLNLYKILRYMPTFRINRRCLAVPLFLPPWGYFCVACVSQCVSGDQLSQVSLSSPGAGDQGSVPGEQTPDTVTVTGTQQRYSYQWAESGGVSLKTSKHVSV